MSRLATAQTDFLNDEEVRECSSTTHPLTSPNDREHVLPKPHSTNLEPLGYPWRTYRNGSDKAIQKWERRWTIAIDLSYFIFNCCTYPPHIGKYCVLNLSDLSGNMIKVCLFKACYQMHHKVSSNLCDTHHFRNPESPFGRSVSGCALSLRMPERCQVRLSCKPTSPSGNGDVHSDTETHRQRGSFHMLRGSA